MRVEKKYVIYGLVVILILVMSVSLAYFQSRIVGDKKDVVVNSKDLKVIYTGGTGLLTGSIEPGFSTSKTFTVKNESGSTYKYDIVIKDLINTFVTSGFLQYKITSTDGGYNMSNYVDIPKRSTEIDTVLAYSISINNNSTHTYTLSIVYTSSETVDQSDDMGKEVSGSLYIKEGTTDPSLASLMLRDNIYISERTDLGTINNGNTTRGIYTTNRTENGDYVYYYSGATTNNWVNFGGFYWRIIRTNEDGSIRLLYAGTDPSTTTGYIGSSSFNNINSESRYVGYMYGGNTSLEDNRTNTTSSTIKGVIDTWYQNNLLDSYDKYISKTAIYCSDRSLSSGTWINSGNGVVQYGVLGRIFRMTNPSYKCGANASNGLLESTQAIADKFSASITGGGNGQLTYPIALMTADELVFAGSSYNDSSTSYSAYYHANSIGESITGTSNNCYWTLSPYYFTNAYSQNFIVCGNLSGSDVSSTSNYIRPVISVLPCAKFTGTGTSTDPYTLDTINSTCS